MILDVTGNLIINDFMPIEYFIAWFCKEMGCTPNTLVNRIEFEYVCSEAYKTCRGTPRCTLVPPQCTCEIFEYCVNKS